MAGNLNNPLEIQTYALEVFPNFFEISNDWQIAFKNPSLEDKVIEEIKNKKILPLSERETPFPVIKVAEEYYISGGFRFYFSNSSKTKALCISLHKKLDFEYYNGVAVKNLLRTVQDEELSLGDRKIIRDIALESFHSMIEVGLKSPKYSFNMLVRTDLHEWASWQLENYGFNLNNPRFYNVDLSN